VSDLRDPDRDPDHLLAPERLIELENSAEPARQRLTELPAPALELVQAWLSAELTVARERALELLGLIHDQLAFQEIKMEVVVRDDRRSVGRDSVEPIDVPSCRYSCS